MSESYEKGLAYYILSALQGYAPAQDKLGFHYLLGLDSKSRPDLAKAFYEKGVECEKNATKTFEYYKIAADKKFPNALFKLENCYENVVGCEKNLTKANELYQLAAAKGNLEAKKKLKK